ncbi:hypothetical protein KFL_000660350 [Klebsormidium nitens]|uniref:Uncharacterized protein n=1 Tax=Klebsormidium nitens TaxID=105231 RepID=A0A1Y1HQN7_KLENI|nr:hypothetical protein KFL_000660350 [Klebsormidium nitens]|eukprot:GAQ80940.1 hypothetical protein KFL_000660350 [Klebsormidium nitens]
MPSFPVTVYDALTELKQLRAQGAESHCARDRYLRLLQELLAYKGGAFVKDILQKHLLSDKIAGLPSLPVELVTRAVDCTLLLTYALTISEEGQQWAVDQGLIRIHAAIARMSGEGIDGVAKQL